MTKEEIILAVMSRSDGASYSPAQIQKLLFLIDKGVGPSLGGPFFNFIPYHYGPFDKEIYSLLDSLNVRDLVDIDLTSNNRLKTYRLTIDGQKSGSEIVHNLDQKFQAHLKALDSFVRSLSFKDLLRTIYKAYPEMRVNSIFQY